MLLRTALRITTPACLAFTGAGGKTTAMFALARELCQLSTPELPSQTVFITTTTHLGADQAGLCEHWLQLERVEDLDILERRRSNGVIAVTGPLVYEEPDRLKGLEGEVLARLHRLALEKHIPLLIEADGARQRPLKAPEIHEPVVPGFVDQVVVVAGLDGLGKPIGQEWVHRPERFAALSGLKSGEPITRQALTRVLLHPEGGLKGIPPAARKIVLLNGARNAQLYPQALAIAAELLAVYDAVFLGEAPAHFPPNVVKVGQEEAQDPVLEVQERVAGIVLAAGEASRFGRPKQLLNLQSEPLVHRSARIALEAGFSPVVVVTGAHQEEIHSALLDLPVLKVPNPKWAAGQSTSLRAGLSALEDGVGAVVFLLADQPKVPVDLLRALVKAHSRTLSAIVAPRVAGKRANPVLLDRAAFPSLYELRGDTGARPLFSDPDRYPVTWVDWDDPSLILDIDTPEDYQRLLEEAGEV